MNAPLHASDRVDDAGVYVVLSSQTATPKRRKHPMPSDPEKDARDDSLIAAVKDGDTDRVRQLLADGANPNALSVERGRPALFLAAQSGVKEITQALLTAGADPERRDFDGIKPFIAACGAGHDDLARLIAQWQARVSEAAVNHQLERLGWSVGIGPDEAELVLTGTESVDDPSRVFDLALAESAPTIDVPFSTFDGWTKQIVTSDLSALAEAAVARTFPWFFDLSIPKESMLARIPAQRAAGRAWRFSGQRLRRFAGDHALPRSRYYTLSRDEAGHDQRTLVREMLAYSHIARTGAFQLLDTADSTAPERMRTLGFTDMPTGPALLLLFGDGSAIGMTRLSFDLGLPPSLYRVQLPVRVVRQKIDRVVDLREPNTANWFAQTVSRAVLTVKSPAMKEPHYFRCWPRRPPLQHFGQLLPAMLSQELGGGALSVAAGILLRRAGANALIFPSARSDSSIDVKNGDWRNARGWNLVDYRDAPPPKPMVVVDVDAAWPSDVGLGCGLDLVQNLRPRKLPGVNVHYDDDGNYRGSFEVDGVARALAMLRDLETEAFRKDEVMPPWWL